MPTGFFDRRAAMAAGLAAGLCGSALRAGDTYPIVDAPAGKLRGVAQNNVEVFKGIPYAQPPVGTLRFRSPRPLPRWAGVRDCFDFGPAAIQTVSPFAAWTYGPADLIYNSMGEDCLSLNIWAPAGARDKPVLVWIHGGGWRIGASSLPTFDGTRYAAEHDVVFIGINYRLGVLGWGAHPDLRDPETGAWANWAIQDQVAALQWIRDNISAFGGDPSRVTVMGHSGGAINAVMHAQNPETAHLLNGIIVLSSPYIAPPGSIDAQDWSRAMEDLAGQFSTSVEGLRSVDAMKLHQRELAQSGTMQAGTGLLYRGPVVDGMSVREWPAYLDWPDTPALVGTNGVEGARFGIVDPLTGHAMTPPLPEQPDALEATVADLLERMYGASPDRQSVHELLEGYRNAARGEGRSGSLPEAVADVMGDITGRHFMIRKIEARTGTSKGNIFYFQHELPLAPPNGQPPHGVQLPIVFGTYALPYHHAKLGFRSEVSRLSRAVREAYSAFARDGVPASAVLPSWPPFDAANKVAMVLGQAGAIGEAQALPRHAQLAHLDRFAVLYRPIGARAISAE